MAGESKLTADVAIRALGGAAGDIDARFRNIPKTVSGISTEISNEWTLLLSNLDRTFAASPFVKGVLNFFADALR